MSKVSGGTVHDLPSDLGKTLKNTPKALTAWEDITPLARNEWICWIESAKKAETRAKRIKQAQPLLLARLPPSLRLPSPIPYYITPERMRRSGRVVDCTALEMRHG